MNASKRFGLVFGVFALAGAVGCADEHVDSVGIDGDEDVQTAAQVAPAPIATISKVEPIGDGCKPGSYQVAISPDGKRFDLAFKEYSVKVAPDVTNLTDARSCSIAVTVKTPTGYSYAVTGVQFNGEGMLEAGVTGAQSVRYRWDGAGAIDQTLTRDLRGPIPAGKYKYDVPVSTNDRVFTPCAAERKLILDTTMILRNGTPKRTGWLNATTVIGVTQTNRVDPSISLTLFPRPCIQ
jgi:hypothetical protein